MAEKNIAKIFVFAKIFAKLYCTYSKSSLKKSSCFCKIRYYFRGNRKSKIFWWKFSHKCLDGFRENFSVNWNLCENEISHFCKKGIFVSTLGTKDSRAPAIEERQLNGINDDTFHLADFYLLNLRVKTRCIEAGAEIKLPPGAGAKLTNCSSGSGSSSGSFLFIKGLKKFYRKKLWLIKKCSTLTDFFIKYNCASE